LGKTKAKKKETRDMPTGTVKWFNTTKGYGFIAPEGGGKDVFVHISAVEKSGLTGLADNQNVSFELEDGRDGRQMAGEIKLLE
tara:strand:- start:314 stop:562 length:249 start_codon:yes stop_codon:yes gene_type:complete